ncbi:MAG: 6-phosphofructokinase [Clostridia bacterium]|nr:6-phosphofructokinase [Clostridia bacterium]
MSKKKIAVLTSGGDAPGMNAAIRSVVRTAISHGMEVMGVYRGYNGLISNDMKPMQLRDVSDIIHRGGTILYTARSLKFKEPEGLAAAVENCKKNDISGVVVIGGDGSFRGARALSNAGIPCIGLPGTIDNDISCSEYTIGFDTAMNTAMSMVDKLRDTAQSHDRCSVVEVMGRAAGDLALKTGIAVGATYIIVPERQFSLDEVIERMERTRQSGKKHFIIVVAEGIGGVDEIARKIEEATGIESRATVLGHVQRGGSPTVRDRVTASRMGYHAVQLLEQGIGNRVVAVEHGKIVDYDISEALNMKKTFDEELYQVALDISI